MTRLLESKTAVVTGAASGIGRAIARTYADHGANVVVADLREEPRGGGTPTHEAIREETDSESAFVECDVTERADLEAAADAAADLGGLDIWVNNAGVVGPMGPLHRIDFEEYREMREINLDAVVAGCQVAIDRLLDRGEGGSVINLSSVAGFEGLPQGASYSTTKGGVRLLTYSLAGEVGSEGIRVNAIHPGFVETSMTTEDFPIVNTDMGTYAKKAIPMGHFGDPEDVANVATFLASDLASYVNAESIVVDGGALNTG